MFVPGLVTGRLFDMGIYKLPIFIASVALVVSTLLIAQCTQYWQFLLCQGFAVGVSNPCLVRLFYLAANLSPRQLSCGVIFGPTLGVVAHWFKKKKGLALGVVAVGSSGGGTLFPIAARNLINEVG